MGFASVLKGLDGKPSGYRECDGEVAYMPERQSYEKIFRKVKIDLATMVILNHDFIKDKERVYRKGILLRGISPEGFRVHNGVYIGNHQVIYTPYGDAKIAHPVSFEALDDGEVPQGCIFPQSYGRDEEFVYFFTGSTDTKYAVRLKACKQPDTFSVLPWGYAKDCDHVYYEHWVVKKANPNTFVVLKDGYAHDNKHVYLGDRMFEADAKSFTVLQDGYAKDCQHFYLHGFIVEEE